ncbi:conjugal transfer protein TraG [Campylobacter jejuni]|nr:conjugal transfer protein TraG [Campylobacter jejuni]EAJ8446851.1 conjugal transfer protein TraG [Campylobacter jejuni]ECR5151201.1 conjugal transfer protein TraG [Campylobacter jejuni]EHP1589817.1 conjugal transfer protein TraG N-terminal domain-containing protein [Campylobacter jejuni]
MNEMLQAVKGITTEANFLFKAALGIGFLIFSVKKAIDNQTSPVMEFGKLLLLGGVTWNLFLSSSNDDKHRFMVYDEVTSKSYVISQLLVGMGVSFALMSNFERVVLKSMEKHFSTPQSTNFSNAGLGFSLQVMSTLPSVKLSAIDATLQKNIDFYFRNCVSVGILLNQQGRNLFQNSDNLIQDLFTNIGNGSQLTPLFENNNNIEKQSVVPCSDAGPQIVEMIKNDTDEAMKIHAALLGMANDMANYEQKFLGAAQIYNEQAVSARSYLQQSMIMLASQDAIINTAKSVGLNPASVAANTAYADQQFYASMQAQGHMAQTYLPLAKAYLTAIIIGLSWLVALLSIVFGSYAHIKMFFTLCIWIVLWTPILCIINFINDFNLMNVAQVITGGKAALSLGDNMLIFKEVANRSNFMNYLVMSTPVLAYAIAKASEQGFVTFASGLSQALTGASRAAGSFANQQALSTQTSIAAPRGDEVWAVGAGVASLQYARNIDGAVTKFNTQSVMGDNIKNSEISNANMTGTNVDGMMSGAKLSAGAMTTVNSVSQANSDAWNKNFNDQYSHMSQSGRASALNEAKGFMEKGDEAFKKAFGNNFGQEVEKRTDLSETEKANIKAYARVQAGGSLFGTEAVGGVEGSVSNDHARNRTLSDKEKVAYNETMERASLKTLSTTKGMDSSWSNTLSGGDSTAYSKMVGYAQSYTQTEQGIQSVSTNNIDNTLNVVARDLAAGDNKDFSSLNTAQQNEYFAKAGNYVSDMIKNDPAQLAQYNSQYGAQSIVSPNNTTMPHAAGMNFKTIDGSERSVLNQSNLNQDQVNQSSKRTSNTTTMPDSQEVKGVAVKSNLNNEVGEKIKKANHLIDGKTGDPAIH